MKKYIVLVQREGNSCGFTLWVETGKNPWDYWYDSCSLDDDGYVQIFEITQEIFKH